MFKDRRIVFSLPASGIGLPLLAGLLAIGWFCCYYLTHDYATLLQDFKTAHGCFYRVDVFTEQYFTPAVKASGNRFCIAGLGLCLAGLVAILWQLRKRRRWTVDFGLSAADLKALTGLWILTAGLWYWGFRNALPAYDEVFSAINVAGEGAGLSIRYYMLPNNHVLFNVLNSLLPGNGGDKVLTGRILSGMAHFGTVVALYSWLRLRKLSALQSFFFGAVLLLLYPVWGFSFQARGYAIYLACCWTALVCAEQYLKQSRSGFLVLFCAVSLVGFAVMPAFLYWHLGLCLWVVGSGFRKKRLLGSFIGWQAGLAGLVFLFYLPGIATSGLAAYTQNPYVLPVAGGFKGFWQGFPAALDSTIRYSFASDVDGTSRLYPIAFCIPVLAWPFCRSREGRVAIGQFLVIWGLFLAMQLGVTRRWPFMRNMVAHSSLFAAVFLVSIHYAVVGVLGRVRFRKALPFFTGALLLITGIHYLRFMYDHLNDLYFNSLTESYSGPAQLVAGIGEGSRVWYSDESFFLHFLLVQKRIPSSHCPDGTYTHFIFDHHLEKLPAFADGVPLEETFRNNQYVLYKRKP